MIHMPSHRARPSRLRGAVFGGLTAALVAFGAVAQAEPRADPSQAVAPPTTKIMAMGRLTAKGAMPAGRRAIMDQEVRDTVRLYLAGKIDQWFVRQDGTGVVFIFNGGDEDAVRQDLARLPLGVSGMMEFQLIALGPLTPLELLIRPPM